MAKIYIISENPLLWAFLMQNVNLGIAKMSVIHENMVFPNPGPKKLLYYCPFSVPWKTFTDENNRENYQKEERFEKFWSGVAPNGIFYYSV